MAEGRGAATGRRQAERAAVHEPGAPVRRGTVWLFAVATAVSVANLYYAQPLLQEIAAGLRISHATAGLVVTLTQLGYAAGLMLLLPLGDLVRRRRLVTAMCAVTAAALVVLATAQSAPVLLAASVVVGAGATTAQVLVPLAAEIAAEHERGTVVGHVMSGLLIGILLARTVAGYLALLGGWRTVFLAAAAGMLVLAAALWHRLPAGPPPAAGRLGYPALLRSVLGLLREEPVLRLRALLGALAFAVFSVLWTALTFLLGAAPYHYPPSTIGLFGLLGAAGALAANLAGRAADRGGARRTTAATAVLLTVSWLPLLWGAHRLAWLIVGVLLLDLAVQGLHVTNQSQVYALRPGARARINSAYMTLYFVGGALGSVLAPRVYDAAGWSGVSALGATLGGCAVLVWLGHLAVARTRR